MIVHRTLRKYISYVAYPAVMVFGYSIYYIFGGLGLGDQIGTYVAVVVSAFVILGLEQWSPHRKRWESKREDIKNDLLFMGFVQVLIPVLLSYFVAITAIGWLSVNGFNFTNVWPHGLSVQVQALLMILAADFLRYWLHLISHRWEFLWRFHSVHHSPDKLYFLNVGRFHPLEKTLQFLVDTAPFIVLGVGEQVVSLYFIFFAINGFFQHSNVELKLGFLNYIISGPELHRWHHSARISESNRNYGNNLIIWDLIFETRYLPKGKTVGELGLLDSDYPQDFLTLLTTPFSNNKDGD